MFKEKKFAPFKMLLFALIIDDNGDIKDVRSLLTNKLSYFFNWLTNKGHEGILSQLPDKLEKGDKIILARSITSYEKV